MGVKEAELHGIDTLGETQYYIKGANFTQSSFMEINGELAEANFVDENTLSVNVNRLRKKLAQAGLSDFITTKVGMGYTIAI